MELLTTAYKDKYRLRKCPIAQVVTGLQVHLQKTLTDYFAFQKQSYTIGFYTIARQLKSFI